MLAAGALKLVAEDFRVSPPSLLVVALALYGGALILGPRIARARPVGDSPILPEPDAAPAAGSKPAVHS